MGTDGGSPPERAPAPKGVAAGGRPTLGALLPGRACRAWRSDAAEGGEKTAPAARAERPTLAGTLLPLPSHRRGEATAPAVPESEWPKTTATPLEPGSAPGDASWSSVLLRSGSSGSSSSQAQATTSPAALDSKALIPEHLDERMHERFSIDLGDELGAGGHGRVFLGVDRDDPGRRVAIKKIFITDGEIREAFQKEVRIMKDLDHPNICKVFESFDEGRQVYLVMEYLEGGALYDRIVKEEALSETACADIAGQVGSALKYAHRRGVAHRDLKPENVCFCSRDADDLHVKVIDWGVGFCFGTRMRKMKSSVGSTVYAAPEVIEGCGAAYTSACDLWSLGVMTYTMLCGQPPFEDTTGWCCDAPRLDVAPRWATLSRDAQDFVDRLIQHDPAERATVDQMLAHPWLKSKDKRAHAPAEQILENMRRFSGASSFFSLCASAVVRQLDHDKLQDLRDAFQDMDANGDGVLELHEIRAGFERAFGPESPHLRDIGAVFAHLDLDGSGAIDYTEFCAAALGERVGAEGGALRAAFRAFEAQDGSGRIGQGEIAQILASAHVGTAWPREVYERTAREVVERFDSDGDGLLDFDEWLELVRTSAAAPPTAEAATAEAVDDAEGASRPECAAEQQSASPDRAAAAWGMMRDAMDAIFGHTTAEEET